MPPLRRIFICDFFLSSNMVVVAQLVRALDCGSRGRRFEPGLPPHVNLLKFISGGFSFEKGANGLSFFYETFPQHSGMIPRTGLLYSASTPKPLSVGVSAVTNPTQALVWSIISLFDRYPPAHPLSPHLEAKSSTFLCGLNQVQALALSINSKKVLEE